MPTKDTIANDIMKHQASFTASPGSDREYARYVITERQTVRYIFLLLLSTTKDEDISSITYVNIGRNAMASDVVMVIASTIKEISPRCNTQTEQLCLRCAYTTEGSSSPEHYCAPSHDADGIIPCPALVCCDIHTEEICYDTVTSNPISCARYDEGGCPCPEGQVKCDNSEHTNGHCLPTDAPCCDLDEQACSDGTCQKYDEGPCPASSRRQPNESSSDNSSSSSGKDFTVKTRLGHTRIGGTTNVEATFHYLEGKCIKDASTVLNSPYTNLSLQRCAKKCVNHGNECKGISFYNTLTKRTSDGVARMTGDCMLVKSVDDDDNVDCNEEDRGKVELYEKEEVLNVIIA